MPPGDLDRAELVELVERIMRAETAGESGEDRLLQRFEDSVAHPAASDLIFHPDRHFGEEYRSRAPTAEQVVDAALAYKPVQLG